MRRDRGVLGYDELGAYKYLLRIAMEAGARDAGLPGSREDPGNHGIGGAIEIGVVEHHDRRFTAKLEAQDREIFRRIAHHMARRLGSASKGDARDERMRGEGGAAFGAETGDDIDDAGRKTCFMDEAGEVEHRARCFFGSL